MNEAEWWRSALDRRPTRQDADRIFFIEPPKDVFADTQVDVPRHRWSDMRRAHYDWLAGEMRSLPAGRKLVDIGCGQSQFRDLLDQHHSCGVDFYPYPNARIVTDLNLPLPFQAGICEVAILSNVLEHIFEPRRLLAETFRVLAPGGRMLLVVPFLIKVHQPPYDFFRYTNFALERLAREAGFAEVHVEGLGNLFDTYELHRWVRSQAFRREASAGRRLMVRALLWAERRCAMVLHRLVPGLRDRRDRDGYPHSFAVRAVKGGLA